MNTPVYTSQIDWNVPMCESDFLYRQQLAELRRHKQNVKRLAIFDFDNTLFKSPGPNPRLWDQQLIGMLRSTDLGWFHDARTLSAPYLEYTEKHWIKPIVHQVRAEMARADTLVMLLTGRSHSAYRKIILGLLDRCRGVHFDIVVLKETPTRQSPLVPQDTFATAAKSPYAPLTFDYKMGVVEDTISAFPGIRQVLMWDDRTNQCERMQHYLDALVERSDGWITCADVYYVPPQIIYMREDSERALVNDMVGEYNSRVRKVTGATDQASLPVGALAIKTYPSHTGVILTPHSRSHLQSAVRSPATWRRACNHMTVVLGPASDEELVTDIGAKMGERVELVVDAVGTIPDRVIAVRVTQVRALGGQQVPVALGTPHITVAFNEPERIRPSEARYIRRWRALHGGSMVLQGTVGEHHLTTAEIVRPVVVKDDVSIGGAVCRRWPELRGREIGAAVVDVRRQMAEQGIENTEANRGRIAEVVDQLFAA
ncbi:hypothetical protein GGF46_004744 [Coemansia sp. RSA 552]|nr:hypothetical protein GGF46_004744 [Coemansia sp. RSA 552]